MVKPQPWNNVTTSSKVKSLGNVRNLLISFSFLFIVAKVTKYSYKSKFFRWYLAEWRKCACIFVIYKFIFIFAESLSAGDAKLCFTDLCKSIGWWDYILWESVYIDALFFDSLIVSQTQRSHSKSKAIVDAHEYVIFQLHNILSDICNCIYTCMRGLLRCSSLNDGQCETP